MADESEPGEKASAEEQANEHVKGFFLALAARGKDTWNTWRHEPANKGVHVTFAGIGSHTEHGFASKRRGPVND